MSVKGGQGERQVSDGDVDSSTATILHIDMDAFFASVELLDRPELRGKPVVVGGAGGRGVVTSATYEARAFGVRSAMPVSQARRLCPQAIFLPSHGAKYSAYSRQVMNLFRDVTPLVEPLSIDEAFLDVAGARRLLGPPGTIARGIRERVYSETGLTCSIGAAATKFVAKVASTRSKPDGLLIVPAERTLAFLHPLPVTALWGVGKATAESLARHGLRTVGDLAQTPRDVLQKWVGQAAGGGLHDLAWGRDPRRVNPERSEKSVGHENTFSIDTGDLVFLRRELLDQSERVAVRLRAGGYSARTIALKLRFADFTTISRSRTLPEPTSTAKRIYEQAVELLEEQDLAGRKIRLIGVRAEQLSDASGDTLSLWSEDDAWRDAEQVMDAATQRFGRGTIRPATLLPKKAPPAAP
ncbi:DNA polymerase IV [Naasia aerilata]|uniref:DNA polymerase IV n=1 Tax=Naasia aerilata TaxID=1162966 RepID=A0ABN6XSM9_9MICO|nr:DNA polymerase IV [Naasia aerilata]BDZ46448.1 DNA polymerase IV [Naasia aerilata]